MSTQTIEHELCQLFENYFGHKPSSIYSLPDSGSQRIYFFISSEIQKAVGTFNAITEENEAFFHLADAMKKSGVPAPEVYAISADQKLYLQQYLGDESLLSFIEKNKNLAEAESVIEKKLQIVLSNLVKFQHKTLRFVDVSKCWPASSFDFQTILSDLQYFFYYFVKQQAETDINEYRLQQEFYKFAAAFETVPAHYLMYRDFQSRNIMLFDDQSYFIDFQGARLGPLQYDLVSLLYQAKAALTPELRNRLTDYYVDLLKSDYNINPDTFKSHLPAFVYLRLMQVLGAYGFRGLIQKKPHFLQSIPFALAALRNHLEAFPLGENFSYLSKVLHDLSVKGTDHQQQITAKKTFLTVSVNSFSYKKKGIPSDTTNNGGGFVFDCRILPNPGRYPQYSKLTGIDNEVIDFLENEQEVNNFLNNVRAILKQGVNNYLSRGFTDLMVSFGCTGGQHRSVYCAATIAQWLRVNYPDIAIEVKHHEQNFGE